MPRPRTADRATVATETLTLRLTPTERTGLDALVTRAELARLQAGGEGERVTTTSMVRGWIQREVRASTNEVALRAELAAMPEDEQGELAANAERFGVTPEGLIEARRFLTSHKDLHDEHWEGRMAEADAHAAGDERDRAALPAFATTVLAATERVRDLGRFVNGEGAELGVWISHVWQAVKAELPDMTLASFKGELVRAHGAGLLRLVRADGGDGSNEDCRLGRASEIRTPEADVHLIEGTPVQPQKRSKPASCNTSRLRVTETLQPQDRPHPRRQPRALVRGSRGRLDAWTLERLDVWALGRQSAQGPLYLRRVPPAPRPRRQAIGGEPGGDLLVGHASGAELAHGGDRQLLGGVLLERAAVSPHLPAERRRAGELAPSLLDGQGGPGARLDERQLVLRHRVQESPHQLVGGLGPVAHAVCRLNPRAARLGRPVDRHGHADVTGEPVSLLDDQHPGAELPQGGQGSHEPRAGLMVGCPTDAMVSVPSGHIDAPTGRPRLDGGPLRFRAQVLLGGADPDVGHGQQGVAGASSTAARGRGHPGIMAQHEPVACIDCDH